MACGQTGRYWIVALISAIAALMGGCAPTLGAPSDPTVQFETAVALAIQQTASASPAVESPTEATPTPMAVPPAVATSVTATPTPVVLPTPPIFTTPPPIQHAGWEDIPVQSLCLETTETYMGIEEEFASDFPQMTRAFLESMSFVVMEPGSTCDATLSLVWTFSAKSGTYSVSGFGSGRTCYTGAEATVEVSISSVDSDPIASTGTGIMRPPAQIATCPGNAAQAPYTNAWARATLDGLAPILGPAILHAALDSEQPSLRSAVLPVSSLDFRELGLQVGEDEMIPVLFHALDSEDEEIRADAASYLGNYIEDELVLAVLIQRLGEDPSSRVRQRITNILSWPDQPTEEVVQVLLRALQDPDGGVRSSAIRSLGRIGPLTKEVVPAILGALEPESGISHAAAVQALGNIGPVDDAIVPTIIHALHDSPGKETRMEAAIALGKIGPVTDEVIPALVDALEDEELRVVWNAIEALGEIGPEAMEAVPALIELFDDNKFARERANEALEAITGERFGEDADAWQAWWDAQQ